MARPGVAIRGVHAHGIVTNRVRVKSAALQVVGRALAHFQECRPAPLVEAGQVTTGATAVVASLVPGQVNRRLVIGAGSTEGGRPGPSRALLPPHCVLVAATVALGARAQGIRLGMTAKLADGDFGGVDDEIVDPVTHSDRVGGAGGRRHQGKGKHERRASRLVRACL